MNRSEVQAISRPLVALGCLCGVEALTAAALRTRVWHYANHGAYVGGLAPVTCVDAGQSAANESKGRSQISLNNM